MGSKFSLEETTVSSLDDGKSTKFTLSRCSIAIMHSPSMCKPNARVNSFQFTSDSSDTSLFKNRSLSTSIARINEVNFIPIQQCFEKREISHFLFNLIQIHSSQCHKVVFDDFVGQHANTQTLKHRQRNITFNRYNAHSR